MKNLLSLLLFLIPLTVTAQVNLSNGLVAYFPFNGSFNDASGAGNHGTGQGGVQFGTDQWGNANNAASFDGIDDYISVQASPALSGSARFSIAFRFQTSSSSIQTLFSKSNYTGAGSPDNYQYHVGINGGTILPSNGLFFGTSHTNTCVATAGASSHYTYGQTTASNQWYCAVLIFDAGVKRVYMNGALVSSSTVTGTVSNTRVDSCTGGGFRIGTWWQPDPRFFRGLIDEVRIYNRALNPQEADSLCNLQPSAGPTVINRYAAVTGATSDCSNGFVVDDATGFSAGDTVLMIQMQGAGIDSSNTPGFGQVLEMNGAGNYEYNTILSVSGNVIRLRNKVLKTYDLPGGRVQFVRVPGYQNYTVSQPHGCMPWNGSKGGVFAIRVTGVLTLNAPVSVSGAGFRGGQPLLSTRSGCNRTDYFYPAANNEGGRKGEGLAILSAAKSYGRGQLANGGGGGNDNNAGGGGGGTFGSGGTGGQQYNVGACATEPDIGGVGGSINATLRTGRMLMGGGGGAGHGNELAEKAGGAGGGILILDAAAINGNAQVISANGADAPQCSGPGNPGGGCMNDGGGGGGGGGQVWITATAINSSLSIEAKGGKGSTVYTGNGVTPSGPGGGGGGGSISVVGSTASRTTQALTGGAGGSSLPASLRWGSRDGSSGISGSSAPVPFATVPYVSTAVKPSFRDSLTGCLTRQLINTTVTAVPGPVQVSWIVTGVGTATGETATFSFPAYGTYEVIQWVTDGNGCRDSIRREYVVSQPVGIASDSTLCASSALRLTARGGISFVWTPSQTLSSPTTQTVTLNDVPRNTPSTRVYQVSVIIGPGCTVIDTFRISIVPAPFAEWSSRPSPPLPNTPVAFTNESRAATSYLWDFGNGTLTREESPTYLFMETRTFNVCLIAYTDQLCPDTSCKDITAQYQQTVAVATGFSPNGDGRNDVLHVMGGPFASMQFVIFNRWGQRVFESTSQQSGWDGRYRGAEQPVDVYSYVATVTFMDGKKETIKGNVTLLR